MQIISMSPQDLSELVQSAVRSTIQSLKAENQLPTGRNISLVDDDVKFSISDLAAYLKCSKVTIHAYKNRRVLPFYQTGKTVFFKKAEVDAALASTKKGLKHA
jgi:excisionase family DNA binding protein